MPKYDVAKVTDALQMVKEGVPQQTIAERTGIGLSTLSRHITAYRAGERPDIDVGELPPPKSTPPTRTGKPASLRRIVEEHGSASTHASRMARDAAAMETEAGRLEGEAARLRGEAERLKKAAKLLEREMAKAEGDPR